LLPHSRFQATTPRDFELVALRVTRPWRDYGIVVAVAVVVGGRGVVRRDRLGWWRWRLVVARRGVGLVVVGGVEDWIGTMGRRRLLRR